MIAATLLVSSPAAQAHGALPSNRSIDRPAGTDPAAASLADEQGISLAAAQTRLAWQAKAGRLSDELAHILKDQFGGVWIGQADGGRIKIGVTSAAAVAEVRRVAARLEVDAVTDTVPVRYSYTYLYAASDVLGAAVVQANAGAPAAVLTGLDPSRNAVIVTVPQGKALTRSQQLFLAKAQQTYGSAVVLEQSATSYLGHKQACHFETNYGLSCDPPLRGGPAIDNGVWLCSAGFITRSKSDSKPYLLTAGHCGGGTWSAHFFDGSSHVIGNWWNGQDNSEGDYQIISINKPGADGWNIRAWVYVNASLGHPGVAGTVLDPDYYISSDGTSSLGDRVCHTGGQGLTDCGLVTQLNATTPWGLQHTAKTNYCAVGGDSGGPVYVAHQARGIHIGGVEGCGDHWFQGVQAAENALRVNVAHGT
jgi:hypothetical protein